MNIEVNCELQTRSLGVSSVAESRSFLPLSARGARNIPCVQHTRDVTRESSAKRLAEILSAQFELVLGFRIYVVLVTF